MSHNPLSARQQADGSAVTALDKARNPFVAKAIAYWQSLCGESRFPARDQLTLRGMASFLQLTVIIAVIDGGADYEYRYVGEAQRLAFRTYFKGMRVSQIEAAAPELGAILRGAYELVRSSGMPLLVQGRIDHAPVDSQFRYHETAFLPLGAGGAAAVDHLLIVGVQVPDPFWEFSDEKLKILTGQVRAE